MAVRPIVHAGFHKTASSWFQDRVYPGVTSHRLVDDRLARETLLGGDAFDFDPVAARRALGADDGGPPLLICEEDLSGVLHNGVVSSYIAREAARRVHATLPEATIVLFVRGQVSAAASWYQQYLREGGTASARRYLFAESYRHLGHARPFKVPHFRFYQIEYRGLIEHYDTLFGRDRVIVMPLETLRRDRAGTLAALGARIGADLPDPGPGHANDAYRAGLIPMLRAANTLTARGVTDKLTLAHLPYWYIVRKAGFKRLNRLSVFGNPPDAKRLLGGELIAWIGQRFWQSNRWLAARTGEDLRAFGYPLDPPPAPLDRPGRKLPLGWMRH
jgi:hypothetical protein